MADIKFKTDYGYAPPSPFWMVWREGGAVPSLQFVSRKAAEDNAANIAFNNPGEQVHVLAAVSTVQTSPDIIGERYDPSRVAPEAQADAPETCGEG